MALKNIYRRSDSHLHHARAPQLIPVPSNPRDDDDDPVVTPTTQPTTPTSTFTRGQISIPTGPPPPLTTPSSVASAPTASATSITSLQDLITSLSSTQQQQVEEEEADAETTPPAERTSRTNNEQLTASRETQSRVTVSQTRSGSLPSSTSAEPEDEGMGMGSIIGMAVAGVAGIAVISAFIVWMIRRRRRQKEYADIDASPFNNDPTPVTRNSTFVVDEPVTHARPQPEMIDRSYTPTPSYGGGFNNAPMNNNAFGYSTQPSYGPGQVIFSPTSAGSFGPGGSPATPLPYNPGYEAQRPGGYAELSRGGPPSPLPFTPNPFENQQQLPPVPPPAPSGTPAPTGEPQYPALSAAPAPAHGQVVDVPASAHENNAAPVQHGYIPPPAALQPGQRKPANRPDTVYDPEDAYGGM